MNRIAILLVAGACAAIAGCGGDDDESAEPPAATATATATATETATAAPEEDDGEDAEAAATVAIEGFAFAPADVTVKAGEAVGWSNEDSARHTVTAKSGATFDSGVLAEGASFEWPAEEAGTVEYVCSLHPSMVGTITVE